MEKLTLKHAVENKFSPVDCVKYFKPEMSDKDADYIIWEETCFPFSNDQMINQLNNKFLNREDLKRDEKLVCDNSTHSTAVSTAGFCTICNLPYLTKQTDSESERN